MAIIGYRYYFDIHMGVGRGPVDELIEVKVGEKVRSSDFGARIVRSGGTVDRKARPARAGAASDADDPPARASAAATD